MALEGTQYRANAVTWLNGHIERGTAVGGGGMHLLWGKPSTSSNSVDPSDANSQTFPHAWQADNAENHRPPKDSSDSTQPRPVSKLRNMSLGTKSDGDRSSSTSRPLSPGHILFADASNSDSSYGQDPESIRAAKEAAGVAQSDEDEEEATMQEGDGLEVVISVGSALHELGGCKPCLFVRTVVGCVNAEACTYCHYRHQRKQVTRANRAKRERLKATVKRQAAKAGLVPAGRSDAGNAERKSARAGDAGEAEAEIRNRDGRTILKL